MRALLLAAGYGSRLRPLTDSVPKCLVPIHGRPLLGLWFELLFPAGIESALVNTHYLSEEVRSFVLASPYAGKVETVYEPRLLGTGGTILANADFFGGDPFLVAHADNLTEFDVAAFIRAHRDRPEGTVMTMMTFDTDNPNSCGIVETLPNGVAIAFHEKVDHPPSNVANAAVYILEPEVTTFMTHLGRAEIDFSTEVIPHFIGRIATWHGTRYHRDIGTPESLRLAEVEYPKQIETPLDSLDE